MTITIGAAEFQRRVVVWRLREGITVDGSGHIDETDESNWRRVADRWAKIIPRGSREFFRGQQVAEEITHKITMRYDSESSGFTTKDRLTLGARKFNIAGPGINTEEQDVMIEFPATEITL